MLHSNMLEAAYTPRYGFYGIYQPRDFVPCSINPIETLILLQCITFTYIITKFV